MNQTAVENGNAANWQAAASAPSGENRHDLTVLRLIGIYVAAALFTLAVYSLFRWAGEMMLVLFMGVLFGVFLHGLARWAGDYLPGGRKTALFAVVSGLGLISVLLGFFCFTRVEGQLSQFADRFDEGMAAVQKRIQDSPLYKTELTDAPEVNIKDDAKQIMGGVFNRFMGESGNRSDMTQLFESSASLVVGVLSSAMAIMTSAFLTFFIGLFLAANPSRYRDGVASLFKPSYRDRAREMIGRVVDDLWGFLIGRGLSMLITGIGAAVVVWMCGVPLALTIGVLTGLLTFIPNIGAIVAWALAAIVALPEGGSTVMWVTIGYIALQIIESYVITPLVQKKQVDLSPAVTLAAQAIFGVLFGIVGALAATPLVVAIKRIVCMAYIEDRLESKDSS